ncbi:PH domain-containing protein [Actinoplanes sp. NEAU-A12]|uniref:PH domain-containing protein n=1 Tax=Actinoplanes sandaracinus TaxID=3045177 RepID=A0ABT6WZZ5_9ACTN|nr:PH domain-containing protein [Actinoplanes sandaracinus]MDI6105155.1 PH domain-containing protein [Actinoplanes sandaracinus]
MTDSPSPLSAQPAETAPLQLRPPRFRVERRAITLWTLHAVIGMIVVEGGLFLTYVLWSASRPWLTPILWILGVIYVVNITVMPTWRYYVHRWETTDEAVYSLKGWLTREWRITPLSRIQSIDTVKGPLQQILKLATVKVTTASREGGITLDGLDAEVAAELTQRLTHITQITPGDAT